MSASLHRILTAAARALSTTEADIRLGWDDRSLAGLGAYAWLAQHYSRATDTEAAQHVGRSISLMFDMRTQFGEYLATQPNAAADLLRALAAAYLSLAQEPTHV